jgi:mannose-6-phosphate isomerase-like protein (cupin superfamily)
MYPCEAYLLSSHAQGQLTVPPFSTVYGYVVSADVDNAVHIVASPGAGSCPKRSKAGRGQYFCHATDGQPARVKIAKNADATVFVVIRHGFRGQPLVGGPIEASGRLCYIDRCSDSLLVYPPRRGDPSLSHLSFPAGVEQSFHIHPSMRLGVVARGTGFATLADREVALKPGTLFAIEEREPHRFRTSGGRLDVIAFHPDGDWGPTDHDHPMRNRTYLAANLGG